MTAENMFSVPDSCFHCCSKCKGLFAVSEDHVKHQMDCSGNPYKCTSMYFACERKIFLQLFQNEDFQTSHGSFSQLNISKDDSFIDHVVKIRMPQDILDPSIFLRTNTSSLQTPLQDSRFLLDENTIEPEVNKSDQFLQSNESRFSEAIEHDQLRKIINKNIDYLKSDDIPSLSSQTNKEIQFSDSQTERRLLSPLEKHFLPDGPKSRVQSPFEKCVNYLQETGSGYQTGSLAYASNQSLPFSCNLSTDLLGGLASTHEENLTSVDELPTLQYLDLAKKDIFFGQNPGLNQVNTKDPFLINATVKADRPVSAGPRYQGQSSKSCEDLQASPTFPLQDGNYFNFPSTLDEPTQLDYLDLATLDFLTNPTSFNSYGLGMYRDRTLADTDMDDIYSECNFLFHDQGNLSSENVTNSEKKSFEDNVKLTKRKIKRIRLKKVKRTIDKKHKQSNIKKTRSDLHEKPKTNEGHKTNDGRTFEALTDSIGKRPNVDRRAFKRTYSAEYESVKPPSFSRKRKLMSSNDTLCFRISPDAKRKVKGFDRKFNESQRLCPTNTILNVKESLHGFSEEEKESMTAVFGQLGCIIVKKHKSRTKTSKAADQVITEVSTGPGENKLFVLEGQNLQTYENPAATDSMKVPEVSPTPVSNACSSDNVKSVLILKCQQCTFTTTSVTEFKNHNGEHEQDVRTSESGVERSVVETDTAMTFTSMTDDNADNEAVAIDVFENRNIRCSNTEEIIDINLAKNQEKSVTNGSQSNDNCLNKNLLELCEPEMPETSSDTVMKALPGYSDLEVLGKTEELSVSVSNYDGTESQPLNCEPYKLPPDTDGIVETISSISTLASNTNSTVELTAYRDASSNMFSETEPIVSLNFEDNYSFSIASQTNTEPNNRSISAVGDDSSNSLNICSILQESPLHLSSVPVKAIDNTVCNRAESFDESLIASNILQQEVLPAMISGAEEVSSQDSWTNIVSEPFINVVMPESVPLDTDSENQAPVERSLLGLNEVTRETLEEAARGQNPTESGNGVEIISEQGGTQCPQLGKDGDEISETRQAEDNVDASAVEEVVDQSVASVADHTHYIGISDQHSESGADVFHISKHESCAPDASYAMKNHTDDVEKEMQVAPMSGKKDNINSDSNNISAPSSDFHSIGVIEHCEDLPAPSGQSSEIIVKEDENTAEIESVDKGVQCNESEDFDIYIGMDTDEIDERVSCNEEQRVSCNEEISEVIIEYSDSLAKECEPIYVPPKHLKFTDTVKEEDKVGLQNVESTGTDINEDVSDDTFDKSAETEQISQHTTLERTSTCSTVDLDHCYCRQAATGEPGHESVSPKVTKEPDKLILFSCSVPDCDYKTTQQKYLNAHLLRHNKEHRLMCDQCTYTTSDRTCLRKHVQSAHYRYYKFKCPDCDYLSVLRENVAKHYRNTHLDEKLYACNQCDYRTGYTHLLKFHLMAHAGIRPYKCTACEYQVNNVNKVTRHIKTRHKGQVGITYEKLDLDFEVDATQFQCEVKTCDKDINVIEVTEEQVKEVIKRQSAKQKKKEKEKDKAKLNIPVYNPKKMKQRMVSILPEKILLPEETVNDERTCFRNIQRNPDQKTGTGSVSLIRISSRYSSESQRPTESMKSYTGTENKSVDGNDLPSCLTTEGLAKDGHKSKYAVKELETEYQCSMCNFRLQSHEDIAQHLLVCKMERNKMT